MAEYIDREALLKGLCDDDPSHMEDYYYNAIANAHTADVVEVVRCKDCVRWSPDGGYGLDLDGTKRLYGECVITNFSHKENHFCSYGVAKMDGKGEGE